jgi:hypothetical protein
LVARKRRFVNLVLPLCGISDREKYNALRHGCQEIFAALRQKFLNY